MIMEYSDGYEGYDENEMLNDHMVIIDCLNQVIAPVQVQT
jgi:hypothetical protein